MSTYTLSTGLLRRSSAVQERPPRSAMPVLVVGLLLSLLGYAAVAFLVVRWLVGLLT